MDGDLFDQDRAIEFPVKAGWKAGTANHCVTLESKTDKLFIGTKLTYPGEGDEAGMRLASDVIFVIKEKPHTYYRREGNNLVYDINITLPEALEHKSLSASVPLIEGGVHRLVRERKIIILFF